MSSGLTASVEAVPLLFARGVIARLALWPALRAAVDNSWGGSASAQKRTWLASELVDAFEASVPPGNAEQPDEEYVELNLLQAMEDEFDVVIEDDSVEPLARDIVALWAAARSGNEALVLEWEAKAEKMRGKRMDVNVQEVVDETGDGEDSEDWEDEDDGEADSEVPQLVERAIHKPEPIVDEDGFTLVQGKGKGRR
ncbi:Pre-rRNA-processing protein TSR2-domain-containing protein [Vararia minispora EC-137]|uniref:Pre-rRNA-processing protein TSR2-domain-containing protein n=1 Tax=Vararia minispora EC-137 TaxID=1314806 RepID=A0ACB8QI94_9AGAM|nr:Pre-rRNA-processing protein TSR2-domain-containing protein [Vararia minispora EC-137]